MEEKAKLLQQIFNILRGQGRVNTQRDFADLIGIHHTNLSRALHGDSRYLTDNLFNGIYERFPELNVSSEKTDNIHAVRYWSESSATGGGVELYDDTQTAEHSDLLVPGFADCTDAVNLFGDSMSPLFNSGEIIILRPWTENWIDYGQIYLVITTNGYRMVKYLQPGNDEEHILCESANTTYKPFEIPKSDILKMYLVKGSICRRTL